jgi:hypothetical protein
MVAFMGSTPVVSGKHQLPLEFHPHINEQLLAAFSQPDSPHMLLENGLIYRWTNASYDLVHDIRIRLNRYANNVRLSVFDGDFYITQEIL